MTANPIAIPSTFAAFLATDSNSFSMRVPFVSEGDRGESHHSGTAANAHLFHKKNKVLP